MHSTTPGAIVGCRSGSDLEVEGGAYEDDQSPFGEGLSMAVRSSMAVD